MGEKHQRLEIHSVLVRKELALFLIFFHQRLENGEWREGASREVLNREQRGPCIPLVVTKLRHD
jgi:hypothetical protein